MGGGFLSQPDVSVVELCCAVVLAAFGEFLKRELYRSVQFSISEELHLRNEKQFRGGLVCKSLRLLYHSTLGRE